MHHLKERGGLTVKQDKFSKTNLILYVCGLIPVIWCALLIAPYLIFPANQYLAALVCMLLVVIVIIAGFTYYTSVAQDEAFKSRFLEMAIISISVAVLSFFVGIAAKHFLGVDI